MPVPTPRAAAAVLALAVAMTACGDDDDTSTPASTTTTEAAPAVSAADIPTITIEASESTGDDGETTYAFAVPSEVTAGPTRINLRNTGEGPHHAQLIRVHDGKTMDDVGAALATGDPGAIFGVADFAGGTGVVDPFGSESTADAIVDLDEALYVVLSFLPDADEVPHMAKGMVAPMPVGPAVDAVALPDPAETIIGIDFGYQAMTIDGDSVIAFTNDADEQLHELNIMRLADGATAGDVEAFFLGVAEPGPPPFQSVGGIQAVMPGATQLVDLDLDAGEYVLFCAIPDPSDGVPHFLKGMISTVTVE